MRMVKLLVHLPALLKTKLDGLRARGTTASGFIRYLLERELDGKEVRPDGSQTAREAR